MKVNDEYHTISGRNILESNSTFREYRRKWREYPESFYVADFPLFLDIDITDICNLRCPFCLRTSNPELIQNKIMSFDTFKKIIDEASKKGVYGIKLNIIGEPLIHPHIHKFIEYAKKKEILDIYFNTNGKLLNKKIAKELIDIGLNRISISFEGYTKEVYERYRVGSDFDTVVNNIKEIQALKNKLSVSHPKIRIQTVLLPELKKDMDNYVSFWKDIVDEVGFLDYQPRVDKRDVLISDWSCSQLWQRMGVLVDGTIIPCNHDERKIMELGNIDTTSIQDAWHSNKIDYMRMLHKKNKSHIVKSCRNCYLRNSEIMKEENNE